MQGRTLVWLTVMFALTLGACDAIQGVRGSGDLVTEERTVSGFDQIDLRGSGTVIIEIGDTESLTIEAEDNLIEFLTSEVDGSTLVLDSSRQISPTRDITYRITATGLRGLSLSGSGQIEASDLSSDTFDLSLGGSGEMMLRTVEFGSARVRLSGSGEITVDGTARDVEVSLSGSGSYNGEQLLSATADVSLSGSGTAIVNASDELDAEVSGSGSIQYVGDPDLSASTPGSGSIDRRSRASESVGRSTPELREAPFRGLSHS